SPENRRSQRQRIEHGERFVGRALVKVRRQRFDRSRFAVAASIRRDDADARAKRGGDAIERVDLVAPAAVKKHDRFVGGGTGCADSNPHRRSSRRERRVRERDVCQAAGESMLRYRFTMKRGVLALVAAVSAFAWLDAAPLTPEQTLDRRSIG